MSNFEPQFELLSNDVGVTKIEGWTIVELSGNDRKKFLNGFCTANVVELQPGNVTEAFILNGKGKTLGYVHVVDFDDRLILAGAGDQSPIIQHLDMYLIREDVKIVDRSGEVQIRLLAGPDALAKCNEVLTGDLSLAQPGGLATEAGTIFIGSDFAGAAVLIVEPGDSNSVVDGQGIAECDSEVMLAYRLKMKTPWFGAEVDETNLPQEIDRDDQTISFTKGCYLGQETVARIDSLGRVNKLLRFATFEGELPAVGDSVLAGESEAGKVLAAAKLGNEDLGVASLMLKRAHAKEGTLVSTSAARFTVLPK